MTQTRCQIYDMNLKHFAIKFYLTVLGLQNRIGLWTTGDYRTVHFSVIPCFSPSAVQQIIAAMIDISLFGKSWLKRYLKEENASKLTISDYQFSNIMLLLCQMTSLEFRTVGLASFGTLGLTFFVFLVEEIGQLPSSVIAYQSIAIIFVQPIFKIFL